MIYRQPVETVEVAQKWLWYDTEIFFFCSGVPLRAPSYFGFKLAIRVEIRTKQLFSVNFNLCAHIFFHGFFCLLPRKRVPDNMPPIPLYSALCALRV